MILVIGATGMVGNEVCRLLISKNLPVRAMLRKTSNLAKRNELQALGVQILEGDLRDKTGLKRVLEGISTVITTVSAMPFSYVPGENDIKKVDEDGMIDLVNAAKSAGVKHFIYTSFSKNLDLDFPLRNTKRKVEKYLQNSGLSYTIVRPSCFMEVWLSPAVGFDAINGKVRLCGEGIKPVAYISIKDVAKLLVECISNNDAINTVLEIGGPENLSQREAVKIFEEALQKPIEVLVTPVEALKAQFDSLEDDMMKSFTGLMICVANGDIIDMKDVLKKFPLKLVSVREFAESMVPQSA